jgi:peptidoglycan/LPS O-acetylase OafA/YrhL
VLVSALSVILVAVVLVSAAADSRHGLIRHLESRPLVYLGTRSYAIYLVQRVGIVTAHAITGRMEPPSWIPEGIVSFVISLGLTLGLAEFAHRVIERPMRDWGRRLAERLT